MTVVTLSHVLHFALFGREMRKTFNNILLTPFLLVQPVRTDSRFCSPQIIKAKNLFFSMVFVQMNTGDVSSKEILSALQHTYENRWTQADLFPVNFEKHITHGRVATHNTAKAVVFSYVILWVCSVIAAADLIKHSSIWKSFCFSFFLSFFQKYRSSKRVPRRSGRSSSKGILKGQYVRMSRELQLDGPSSRLSGCPVTAVVKIALDVQGGKVSSRDGSWDLRVRSHHCPQLCL